MGWGYICIDREESNKCVYIEDLARHSWRVSSHFLHSGSREISLVLSLHRASTDTLIMDAPQVMGGYSSGRDSRSLGPRKQYSTGMAYSRK